MKLSSLFKKETKKTSSKVQTLVKNQLEKVIGGTEEIATDPVLKKIEKKTDDGKWN